MIGQNKFSLFIKYFLLSIFALITIFPLLLTVSGGLKSFSQLRLDVFGIPNPVEWGNYVDVLDIKRSQFFHNLFNSAFITFFTVAIVLIMCCLAGYALSRIKFPGREIFYNYFLIGLLFPPAIAILPLYILLKSMNLLDNYFGVILPQAAFSMPFNIILIRGFFQQVPMELQEAALIDGCGSLRFLVKIMIPLSSPVLTTISVIVMVASWNNFFLPLLVLGKESLFTLPMGVMSFQGQYLYQWQLILAFVTLSMIPIMAIYIFGQKYIIAGLTGGAVKQ